jgi:hypothetical protein
MKICGVGKSVGQPPQQGTVAETATPAPQLPAQSRVNLHQYASWETGKVKRVSLQVWLKPHTIAWLRGTRNFASINSRAEEVLEAAERAGLSNTPFRFCACGCCRQLIGRQKTATPACRKRLQRKKSSHLTVTK